MLPLSSLYKGAQVRKNIGTEVVVVLVLVNLGASVVVDVVLVLVVKSGLIVVVDVPRLGLTIGQSNGKNPL